MNLNLTGEELRKVLIEKFGIMDFRIFYTESDKQWEARNDQKISELKEDPKKESHVLYLTPSR